MKNVKVFYIGESTLSWLEASGLWFRRVGGFEPHLSP